MAECKIVLTATAGMIDFLANCLSGIHQNCDLANVCVVVPDEQADAFEYLKDEYDFELAALGSLIDLPRGRIVGQDYAEYGTVAFSDFMSIRVPLLRTFLSCNDYVIFSDIDVAWIKDPLPYLKRVLDHCGVAMQTEASEIYPPPFCMGFMAFKSGHEALDVLDWFERAFDADRNLDPTATMQVTLNRILGAEPARARAIFPLPEALFPNGRLHRLFLQPTGTKDLAQPPESFIFHANWAIGAEAKREMLRRASMWSPRTIDDERSYKVELSRLDRALKLERAMVSELAEKLASEQRQTALLSIVLLERTEQAETLLSHVTAAYAEIEAIRTSEHQAIEATTSPYQPTQSDLEA
jgi:hypothetical protein